MASIKKNYTHGQPSQLGPKQTTSLTKPIDRKSQRRFSNETALEKQKNPKSQVSRSLDQPFSYDYEVLLRQDFKNADEDGDGLLDVNEFSKILNKFGFDETIKNDMNQAFKGHDADNDHGISVEEFISYVRQTKKYEKLAKEYTEMFKEIDTDHDGFLSPQEVKNDWAKKGLDLSDNSVLSLISSFDTDSDKKISLHEYLNILKYKYFHSKL